MRTVKVNFSRGTVFAGEGNLRLMAVTMDIGRRQRHRVGSMAKVAARARGSFCVLAWEPQCGEADCRHSLVNQAKGLSPGQITPP